MKRKATPQRPKTRAHKMLFDREQPYQPKRVELKNRYQRHPKHRARVEW